MNAHMEQATLDQIEQDTRRLRLENNLAFEKRMTQMVANTTRDHVETDRARVETDLSKLKMRWYERVLYAGFGFAIGTLLFDGLPNVITAWRSAGVTP